MDYPDLLQLIFFEMCENREIFKEVGHCPDKRMSTTSVKQNVSSQKKNINEFFLPPLVTHRGLHSSDSVLAGVHREDY